MKILAFLQDFAQLTRAEQQVFIFALKNCPFPRWYSGDLQRIAQGSGIHLKTVERAFKKISRHPRLRRLVCYIHVDVKQEFQREVWEAYEEGHS
jgi:hypothetical protein